MNLPTETQASEHRQSPANGTASVVGCSGGLGSVAIASVMLSKLTPFAGGQTTTHTMTLHHRAGVDNEDQMRGIAVREAMKIKPGFSVDDVLVTFVALPNTAIRHGEDGIRQSRET